MKIAYIVYHEDGPFAFANTEHDSLLQFLRNKGLDIHKEAWADEGVQWESYQCVVLKSPWDYVQKPGLFYAWLNNIKRLNIPLLNSADVVRWNSDKHYLLEIEEAGLKIIPTSFLEKDSQFEPDRYFDSYITNTLIVKPCISGSSKNTFKLTKRDKESRPVIDELLKKEAMLVQPFMPEINEEGEWSLMFFNGKFSHALVKTPVKEDFRSQLEFGGVVQGKAPGQKLLDAASEYVSAFAKDCLYARVDGLIIKDEFYLMELELIDPYLFLSVSEDSYDNYYNALKQLLPKLHPAS